MGGAPLTHPDEIVADKPEPKPEPLAAQEEDALASSPLFDPEPTEPQDAPRAEEEPARPDYAGFTMPTPQAVASSNAQAPKGRLRIDPVKTLLRLLPPRRPASGARCFRANCWRRCWRAWA